MFLNPIPLKAPELVMYACFGLIHLVHTESTQSQTLLQLSQCGMRLYVNWVNAEYTNIQEDFIILRWLSWRGVSLRVDSVDVEAHLALTQLTRNETSCQLSHCQMLKNLNKSANSRTKSKKFKSLIIWTICVRDTHGGGWSRNINARYLHTLMVYL